MSDDFPTALILISLVSICICGGLGYAIGDTKGQPGLGGVLGALLGPVGLLILALLPSGSCGVVISHQVRRGTASDAGLGSSSIPLAKIVKPQQRKPRAPRCFIYAPGGEVRGPYTSEEISRLRDEGDIDSSTLFCREGTQEWISEMEPAREVRPF